MTSSHTPTGDGETVKDDRRLRDDPVFRQLHDTIYRGLVDGTFTPTDVREALVAASVRYEAERLEPRWIPVSP